jgi:hypothetical protein
VAGRIEDYAIGGGMQSAMLGTQERRRQPGIAWDERQSVPG